MHEPLDEDPRARWRRGSAPARPARRRPGWPRSPPAARCPGAARSPGRPRPRHAREGILDARRVAGRDQRPRDVRPADAASDRRRRRSRRRPSSTGMPSSRRRSSISATRTVRPARWRSSAASNAASSRPRRSPGCAARPPSSRRGRRSRLLISTAGMSRGPAIAGRGVGRPGRRPQLPHARQRVVVGDGHQRACPALRICAYSSAGAQDAVRARRVACAGRCATVAVVAPWSSASDVDEPGHPLDGDGPTR